MSYATEHFTSKLPFREGLRRCHVGWHSGAYDGYAHPGLWPGEHNGEKNQPGIVVEKAGRLRWEPIHVIEMIDGGVNQ